MKWRKRTQKLKEVNTDLGIRWEHKEICKFVLDNTFSLFWGKLPCQSCESASVKRQIYCLESINCFIKANMSLTLSKFVMFVGGGRGDNLGTIMYDLNENLKKQNLQFLCPESQICILTLIWTNDLYLEFSGFSLLSLSLRFWSAFFFEIHALIGSANSKLLVLVVCFADLFQTGLGRAPCPHE